MKTLVFVFVLLLSRIALGQYQDIRWGISNGPVYLIEGIGQLDVEYFFHRENSLVLGLGYQNKFWRDFPLNNKYYDEYDDDDGYYKKGPAEGFKVDLLHKYYIPFIDDEDGMHTKTYHSLFLIHGPIYHFYEQAYDVEIWAVENDVLVLKEGRIYDYVNTLSYSFGAGYQFLTNHKKFFIEVYLGARYQYSWVDKSPNSQNQENTLENPGYIGFVPQFVTKLGIYFLRKNK